MTFRRDLSHGTLGEIYVTADVSAVDAVYGGTDKEQIRTFRLQTCVVMPGQVYKLWVDAQGHLQLEVG